MGRAFSIRLNDEEAQLLETLKKKLGLWHDAEVVRMAIRLAYDYYIGGRRGE